MALKSRGYVLVSSALSAIIGVTVAVLRAARGAGAAAGGTKARAVEASVATVAARMAVAFILAYLNGWVWLG